MNTAQTWTEGWGGVGVLMTFVVFCQHENNIFNGFCNHLVGFLPMSKHGGGGGWGGVWGVNDVRCQLSAAFLLVRLLLFVSIEKENRDLQWMIQ